MVQALICLFSKRDDITFQEFKDAMENRFVPLLEKLTGPLFPLTYSRRYIAQDGNDRERHRSGPLGLPSLIVGEAESITWPFATGCPSGIDFRGRPASTTIHGIHKRI
ncbi:hypothetical protein PMIN06_002717 [Paraphaeosphaeria minitans]